MSEARRPRVSVHAEPARTQPPRPRDRAARQPNTRASRDTRALRPGHRLTLLKGAAALFDALARDIDGARAEVLIETYILAFSGSVLAIAEALERAAARGVAVRVVVDGIGTPSIPSAWQARWKAAGVEWRTFNPARGWRVMLPTRWRRLHRKLCAIDGRVAFCGGINLLDDYVDPNHGVLEEPRFDFAVRATGPLVADVHETMTRLWLRMEVVSEARSHDYAAAFDAVRNAARAGADMGDPSLDRAIDEDDGGAIATSGGSAAAAVTDEPFAGEVSATTTVAARSPGAEYPGAEPPGAESPGAESPGAESPGVETGITAALVLRDNLRFRRRIERTYRFAIGQAKSEVIIACAYFVPGVQLQRALLRAAKRGVRVSLLLQGRYEYFMQHHTSRALYGVMLDAGIEIIEYRASFLHAKVAVMDAVQGAVSTVGSSNLDPISLLLAREANIFVRDDAFAAELRAHLVDAMSNHGSAIDNTLHGRRSLVTRGLAWLAYTMMRIALFATRNRY